MTTIPKLPLQYVEGENLTYHTQVLAKDFKAASAPATAPFAPVPVQAPFDLDVNGAFVYVQIWADLDDAAPVVEYTNDADEAGFDAAVDVFDGTNGRFVWPVRTADLTDAAIAQDSNSIDYQYVILVRDDPATQDIRITVERGVFRIHRRGTIIAT
jgi:hypothetical protein